MKRIRWQLLLLLSLFSVSLYSQDPQVSRVEPPFWWVGMKSNSLQLMVYGENISLTEPDIRYNNVNLREVHRTANPNYLFLDLEVDPEASAGDIPIVFSLNGKRIAVHNYSLYGRRQGSAERMGFGPSDVVYLLMPDRFANGDPSNDNVAEMKEQSDRTDPNGRHGGDIRGIIENLDYIRELGVTVIWPNPLLENDLHKYSYHGYAITDYYMVDPRLGTNEDYLELVEACHGKGLKVIMDMVFNHCGIHHWWMRDLPGEDWINQWPEFTRSNYRNTVLPDPYSSQYDLDRMQKGWFDTTMADLNQHNRYLANYLLQNSIWWVEYAGLDGIRMDTYPYAFQDFMAGWVEKVLHEYPHLNILGECWLQKEALTGYYDGDPQERLGPDTHLPSITDFPMYFSMDRALNKPTSWTEGLSAWYYVLAQDIVYNNPYYNVIFADNHDVSRFYTTIGEDLDKYKLGMLFILTTRGIPMIYYGTEILMTGDEHAGHGFIRKDFPGGWSGDTVDAFRKKGLNIDQEEALRWTGKLINWRKNSKAIHEGKLIQFIPQDTTYVYFRIHPEEAVMVVLNMNSTEKTLQTERFRECLNGYRRGRMVMAGKEIEDLSAITIPAMSAEIIELYR